MCFPTAVNPKVCPRFFLHKLILNEAQAHKIESGLAYASHEQYRTPFSSRFSQQVFVNADTTAVISDIAGFHRDIEPREDK